MANVTDLIAYYANLLIIQYNGLPKAQATIELIAQTILCDGIVQDIQNAYDIDTAVGAQLDVVGKYQGIDRYYSSIDLINYFSLITYSQVDSPPSSPPQWGFTDYADFETYQYNGTLVYSDIITVANALSDDDFRILIRLAILNNNSNYSAAEINDNMWSLFGNDIRPESLGNMVIQYFINVPISPLIQAILFKGMLPAPMGVGIEVVTGISGEMFALVDYGLFESPYGYGLSDYADYDTLPGEVLTYGQISEG